MWSPANSCSLKQLTNFLLTCVIYTTVFHIHFIELCRLVPTKQLMLRCKDEEMGAFHKRKMIVIISSAETLLLFTTLRTILDQPSTIRKLFPLEPFVTSAECAIINFLISCMK